MTQNTLVTAPERLQTYKDNPGGKRLPFSCTLAVLKAGTNIGEIINWVTLSLKAGAGAKLIIDESFRLPEACPDLELVLNLDPNHPDWKLAESEAGEVVSVVNSGADLIPGDSIDSISDTWQKLYDAPGGKVIVDLSKLRCRDSVNSDGLLASGPLTFAQVYSAIAWFRKKPTIHSLLRLFGTLNEVILRGGYKKGIITSSCIDTSPYYDEYLGVPLVSLRGSHKKGVILTHPPTPGEVERLCTLVNYESLFLQKGHTDRELFANVCMGIFLKDRGTCLINRVNLGQVIDIAEIPSAFVEATIQAIDAHVEWRRQQPERAIQWADLVDDNQIAMDVMGLSNLLRRLGITYSEFIDALYGGANKATELVEALRQGYAQSSDAADARCKFWSIPKMVRLHCVEPAQAHSYRTSDAEGYTTCRGIWPPFSQVVNRYSQSNFEPNHTYNHGRIERITPDQHLRLCAGWHMMMEEFGRVHAVSFDTWEQFDNEVFSKWYNSPLQTLYYNMSKDYSSESFARKRFTAPALCSSCAD